MFGIQITLPHDILLQACITSNTPFITCPLTTFAITNSTMKKILLLLNCLVSCTVLFSQPINKPQLNGRYSLINTELSKEVSDFEITMFNDNFQFKTTYDSTDHFYYGTIKYKDDSAKLFFTKNRPVTISGKVIEGMNGKKQITISNLSEYAQDDIKYTFLESLADTTTLNSGWEILDNSQRKTNEVIIPIDDTSAKYVVIYIPQKMVPVICSLPDKYNAYSINIGSNLSIAEQLPYTVYNKQNSLFISFDSYSFAKLLYKGKPDDAEINVINKSIQNAQESSGREKTEGFNNFSLSDYNDYSLFYHSCERNWNASLKKAAKLNKQILLIYCTQNNAVKDSEIDYDLYNTDAIIYKAKNSDNELLKKYNIVKSPTVILTQPDGTLISKMEGILPSYFSSFIRDSNQQLALEANFKLLKEFAEGNREKNYLVNTAMALSSAAESPGNLSAQNVRDTLINIYGNVADTAIVNAIFATASDYSLLDDTTFSGSLHYLVNNYNAIANIYKNCSSAYCDDKQIEFYNKVNSFLLDNIYQQNSDTVNTLLNKYKITEAIDLYRQWLNSLNGFAYYNAINYLIELNYRTLEDNYPIHHSDYFKKNIDGLIHNYFDILATTDSIEKIKAILVKDLAPMNGRNNPFISNYAGSYADIERTPLAIADGWKNNFILHLNNYAWEYYKEKSKSPVAPGRLIAWSKKTIDLVPNNAFYMDTYAHLLYKQGKKADAIKLQTAAVSISQKKECSEYSDSDIKNFRKELQIMKNGLNK